MRPLYQFAIFAVVVVVLLAALLYAILAVRTYTGTEVSTQLNAGWRMQVIAADGENVTATAESTAYFDLHEVAAGCGGELVCANTDDPFYGVRENASCFRAGPKELNPGSVYEMFVGSADIDITSEREVMLKVWMAPEGSVGLSILASFLAFMFLAVGYLLADEAEADYRRLW